MEKKEMHFEYNYFYKLNLCLVLCLELDMIDSEDVKLIFHMFGYT